VNRSGVRSLGRRLSWWLALQTLAGLGAVGVVVYAASALNLSARQLAGLTQKQAMVQHVLQESVAYNNRAELQHRLDDLLAGHSDLALSLRSNSGERIYQSSHATDSRFGKYSTFNVAVTWPDAASLSATLSLDTDADKKLLQQLGLTLLAASAAGALLVSVGGFWLVRHGLAPIKDLVDQTDCITANSLHQQLNGSAQPEELQPLVNQFNALLRRLDLAYAQLEGFNADVAHELCTPLATLISATELALRKQRSVDELIEVLASNLEDLRRLAGIVQDMLFLSRADRGAVARREPTPSLASVVAAVADYHDAALEEARLTLQIVGDACGDFDTGLLRRALSNLIGNATRFAVPTSSVNIEITELPDQQIRVAVVNRGESIEKDQLQRLFDRFFRADAARSEAGAHHGLGLAIVAAIARMHSGSTFAQSHQGLTSIGLTVPKRAQQPGQD
jgi:two-component system heavy metal sensor histidine kinase CusS